MKSYLMRGLCIVLLFFIMVTGSGQKMASRPAVIFTADSLIGGNAKDILINFFQFAFNNLTSGNRELEFNSNPYAVLLKNDPSLAIDYNYKRYKLLRKLNVGFGLRLDTSFRFNGFSSGLKYALINERDVTTSKLLFSSLQNDALGKERRVLQAELDAYGQTAFPHANDPQSPDFTNKKLFTKQTTALFNDKPLKQMDTGFQAIVKKIVSEEMLTVIDKIITLNPDSSFKNINVHLFDNLKNTIKNNLLWTIAVNDTTYKDNFFFSNILVSSELSKGIFKPKPGSNLELNIKAACNFLKDSMRSGKNLQRVVLNFEPGLNWVIRNKDNDRSFFEFKLSGSYSHNCSSLYTGERRDILTLNSILRIRIYNDLWIPLQIKYDPNSGNVLGLFNVRLNFTGMGKSLKG